MAVTLTGFSDAKVGESMSIRCAVKQSPVRCLSLVSLKQTGNEALKYRRWRAGARDARRGSRDRQRYNALMLSAVINDFIEAVLVGYAYHFQKRIS